MYATTTDIPERLHIIMAAASSSIQYALLRGAGFLKQPDNIGGDVVFGDPESGMAGLCIYGTT